MHLGQQNKISYVTTTCLNVLFAKPLRPIWNMPPRLKINGIQNHNDLVHHIRTTRSISSKLPHKIEVAPPARNDDVVLRIARMRVIVTYVIQLKIHA